MLTRVILMHSLCDFHGLEKIKVEEAITEKYRPEPGYEPRVSRFAHEHSTIELSRSIQFCYLNLGLFLITLVLYRGAGVVHVCRT